MATLVAGRYVLDRMEVNLSRKGSFFTSLREDLRETFLPEDPFRRRPDEAECHHYSSRSTLMLTYLVPILEWGPKYNLAKFQCDLLAGFTVAVLAVPQGISYARLAYLHPVIGLCIYDLLNSESIPCLINYVINQLSLFQIRVSSRR